MPVEEFWLYAFGFGVVTGAAAVYVPWLHSAYKQYVLNCKKVTCPHHGEDNTKQVQGRNDTERNGPTRPRIK